MAEGRYSQHIGGAAAEETLIRAAEYVRMSTDHQQYSTENQSDAIREYAAKRGMEIVRTYADHGKSGMSIAGRDALQRLLADVASGKADYSVILVYDVSRWGRFQDSDEGAANEHMCKKAGITIQYCAEQFENDGSAGSDIIKNVKRVMAKEYSRELSRKVFVGQCRLIELGYRQGGPAGYGLRRQLVDHTGMQKGILVRGEQKSIQTDRVVLVPGPEDEISTVRWIYSVFVEHGCSERQIAEQLNARGLRTDLDRPWTQGTVHEILINEKYVGHNVWNRTSSKLSGPLMRNPAELHVRRDGAFAPVVDRQLFEAAQTIIRERARKLTDDEMLEFLCQVLARHGDLSGLIIDESDGVPSSSSYQSRFGSLLRAYQLIGFTPERDYSYIEANRALRAMHPVVVAETVSGIRRAGGRVDPGSAKGLLRINDEITMSIVLARCQPSPTGILRWHIRLDTGLAPDITVAVRLAAGNLKSLDYYLLPWLDLKLTNLRMREENGFSLDAYRFDTLDSLFELTARTRILEVA